MTPSTGGLSSIVTLSAPGRPAASSLSITMAANTSSTYNAPFVTANTPTATGQYQITIAGPGNVTSAFSSTVSVSQPAINGLSIGALGVGMHRTDTYISLDSPAPSGGLVLNLTSSDPSKVQVQGSATVAAGSRGLNSAFMVTGLATTIDGSLRDHPVTITASVSDGSWTSATTQVTVQPTLVLVVQNVTTTRTTRSAPDTGIYADLRCATSPVGGDCGVLNADLPVTFSAMNPSTSSPSAIVTLGAPGRPAGPSVTIIMAANTASTYNAPFVTAGTPAATGQYRITVSAPGNVNSDTSNTVTVTP
jgi:hypothetical protein